MPVHGLNDYEVPYGAVDYKHLKYVKQDFDATLLAQAFIAPKLRGVKRFIPIPDNAIGIAFWLIIVAVIVTITVFIQFPPPNGVIALLFTLVLFVELYLYVRYYTKRIQDHFKIAYEIYLEGYRAVLNRFMKGGTHSSKYKPFILVGNYSGRLEYQEVYLYGVYAAIKFFLPGSPKNLLNILLEAGVDSHYTRTIRYYRNDIEKLQYLLTDFMEKYHIEAIRYRYYISIFPDGYDENVTYDVDNNPISIKEYVGFDGEIYRYKTESELMEIKIREEKVRKGE